MGDEDKDQSGSGKRQINTIDELADELRRLHAGEDIQIESIAFSPDLTTLLVKIDGPAYAHDQQLGNP